MDSHRLARMLNAVGAGAHFFGILAGASALYNLWQGFGRMISYSAPLDWWGILYRAFLCVVFVTGGLALGRWGDRIAAEGDSERAKAAEAERAEAERLTRQIIVPRRRSRD